MSVRLAAARALLTDIETRARRGSLTPEDFDIQIEARTAELEEVRPPKWPAPLADEALHGLAGDFVNALSPHTEADPVAILIQFLSAFGNCVGRSPYYLVEGDRHHANVYAVLVGQTSKGRKGTSWGRTRTAFEAVEGEPWARERIHGGMSSGEGLIWAVRDEIMGRERVGKGADAQYRDIEVDAGVADKRLMVIEPEFAGVLRVMAREGNTLSRVIRDAWDRGNLATMTKNSPAKATGAHISIVGHVSADELRRYLDRTEMANGFANRFCLFCVRRSRILPFGSELPGEVSSALARRLAMAIGTASKIERVTMNDSARAIWISVYCDLSEGHPGLLGAITGRAEAQVVRLALIYALLDGKREIDAPHLLAGLAVWEYAETSARFVFGDALGDPIADVIVAALRDGPKTRTELRDTFGRHRTRNQIERALQTLLELDRVAVERTATEGRPSELWSLRRDAE